MASLEAQRSVTRRQGMWGPFHIPERLLTSVTYLVGQNMFVKPIQVALKEYTWD
jgi:hypothetical protein